MLLNKCLVQLFIILSCIYFDCPSVIPECDNYVEQHEELLWNINKFVNRSVLCIYIK